MTQAETLAVGMVERRKSRQIQLGRVAIGGDAPVSVQSMTTTKTADIDATLQQIASLVAAGVDIVRVAVPHWEDAEALSILAAAQAECGRFQQAARWQKKALALAPEEDVLLLDLAFLSTIPESTMRVPSYAAWLETVDQAPAYRWLRRALQALQWQRRPEGDRGGWVLKTPHHLEWIDALDAAPPDALYVWTHRDPAEVVPSFCSMIAHGRGVFSDDVDPHEIGASWLRKGARMVDRALDSRARIGERRFLDVRYRDLMKDPVAVTRAIEERAGLPWTAEVEARLAATLAVEKQHRFGVHRYDLRDFALADADVDRAFARYRAELAAAADKRAAAPTIPKAPTAR